MLEPIYVERQNFSPWVFGILLAVGVGGLLVVVPSADAPISVSRFMSGFVILGVSVLFLNTLCMTIRVLPDQIAIHFGRTFYFYSKHINLDAIRRVEAVDYKPIRESGRWGIRWGKHEGEKARYFSARGTRGVLLETDNGVMIVGSSTPDRLVAAIRNAQAAAKTRVL